MGNVAPWMFESIFSSIPGLGSDWQLLIQKKNNKDLLEFKIEREDSFSENDLKQAVWKKFESDLSDAWKMNQMSLFEWTVSCHPKGTLRKGRKLVRILDERKF
jgi:phenylacetate-coenzyme A ligase PaaK-like adenylate-forming protein